MKKTENSHYLISLFRGGGGQCDSTFHSGESWMPSYDIIQTGWSFPFKSINLLLA